MSVVRSPLKRTPIALALMAALSLTTATVPAAPAMRPDPWTNEMEAYPRLSAAERQQAVADWQARRPSADAIQAQVDAWRARPRPAHVKALSALALAKSLHEPSGTTHEVLNCDDSGPGSLRETIAGAASGDTIDLSQLMCSTITLTTGSILVPQADLSLIGPGVEDLTINGNHQDRVLTHSSTGALRISELTLADGTKYSTSGKVEGGCVRSSGSVVLNAVEVRDCLVGTSENFTAKGGGIYASDTITVTDSVIRGNSAANKYTTASFEASARGGGLSAVDGVALYDSLVIDNQAYSLNLATGGGIFVTSSIGEGFISKYSQITENAARSNGGVHATAGALIVNTTINNNQAERGAGGYIGGLGKTVTIQSSTISGNIASGDSPQCAALELGPSATLIANSTIAWNSCEGSTGLPQFGGLCANPNGGTLRLESTIIADNFADGAPSDLNAADMPITGNNNLIFETINGAPPAGTLIAIDPQLKPLAYNGGPTPTHAPSGNSPAIDAGNNVEGEAFDQRGDGFPRVVGAAADIGAYELSELELNDLIFAHDFELPVMP